MQLMKTMSARAFEKMREADQMEADAMYRVVTPEGPHFAYSPDGVGAYWYDTVDEMLKDVG